MLLASGFSRVVFSLLKIISGSYKSKCNDQLVGVFIFALLSLSFFGLMPFLNGFDGLLTILSGSCSKST